MPTIVDNIPEQIRALRRWVCVDAGSKVPMRAFEPKTASVSKPDTWSDFDEAAEKVERGVYEYVGFVFADDGLVGIDIDHAFDDDGLLSEEAVEAIRACSSYTEVSKSGDGIHIVCAGSLPFRGRNNRAGWEIYRESRYFVLTGQVVMFGEIARAQEGIDLVLERHFADVEREGEHRLGHSVIWEPTYEVFGNGRFREIREKVRSGVRHLSMVSFCGQVWSALAHYDLMLELALKANAAYMDPPLPEDEIAQIARSVTRYRR